MGDTHAVVDEDNLTRAMLLWTGRGTRSWRQRDDAALVREFGEARGLDLLLAIRSLEADFYRSEAHLTEPDLQSMTARASAEFQSRHPDAPAALVDALAWCYSFDYT
jgi:hypothetical protein